eukprot:g22469.t1
MNDHPIKGIGNAGAQAVAKMLRENRSVQEIYLHDKRIGEIGGQALLEALRHNSRVLVMNLNENPAISDEVKKGIQGLLEANKEAVRRQKEAFFATLKELQRLSEAKPGMGKSILDRLEGTTWFDDESKCRIAHVQSGEIVWDPNVGTRANSTLISDGIILVATVTTANEEVVLRGEVDLDAEPACITWSCWNDLPSEIQSFMWIKG